MRRRALLRLEGLIAGGVAILMLGACGSRHKPPDAAKPGAEVQVAAARPVAAPANDVYDLVGYGKECARLITAAPPFDCRHGQVIPITVNGRTPKNYTRHMSCDRPALLPYPEHTDGQCAPYSRVHTVRDDDVQMLLFCRRMYIRNIDSPYFDSIEIIMHNVVTGSTCFFISKGFGKDPQGLDGRRVPPPSEETPPDGFISARDLWMTPQQVADHGCIFCHDSDPWMHTPWVAQTTQLPADPFGFHSVDVGGPFDAWPKPESINTRGNTCTGCHRIGSLSTCGTRNIPTFGKQPPKMLQAVGQAPSAVCLGCPPRLSQLDKSGREYPHSYWMPVSNALTLTNRNVVYQQSVKDLERCCENHDAPGCIVKPITNKAEWEATVAEAISSHDHRQW